MNIEKKHCPRCQQTKDAEREFGKRVGSRYWQSWCTKCRNENKPMPRREIKTTVHALSKSGIKILYAVTYPNDKQIRSEKCMRTRLLKKVEKL